MYTVQWDVTVPETYNSPLMTSTYRNNAALIQGS